MSMITCTFAQFDAKITLDGRDILWNPYLCTEMEIAQQNGRLRYGQQQN